NPDRYDFQLALKGDDTDLSLDGNYVNRDENPQIDISLDLKKFGFETISKLSGESLKDASGYLSGEFSVSGTTDSPDYEGYLQFNDAVFNPTLLNTKFALTDDKIAIDNEGIRFNDFSIADRDGNKFYIDGTISTKDITDPELDLSLDADGFQLMDSSEKDNDMFYGKANFDLHGKLT